MLVKTAIATVLTFMVLATPLAAEAQQADKVYRLAILGSTRPPPNQAVWEPLVTGLRDHGYTEGRNLVFDVRYAEGRSERFPGLAAELLRLQPDLIVAVTEPAVQAAKSATRTIPIVMLLVGDPVQTGLVASISKPGGNVTGLTTLVPQLTPKRLEILVEFTRSPARVAFLRDPGAVNAPAVWEDLQRAARQLNVTVSAVDVREAPDIERALAQVARDGAKGLLVDAAPILFLERRRIFEFASVHRLPTVYFFRVFVDAGGLVSYGPDFGDQFRRAASYVDRILKGARPGDLPVEQPTNLELVINMKTAAAMGITIPRSLLLRADRVIE